MATRYQVGDTVIGVWSWNKDEIYIVENVHTNGYSTTYVCRSTTRDRSSAFPASAIRKHNVIKDPKASDIFKLLT